MPGFLADGHVRHTKPGEEIFHFLEQHKKYEVSSMKCEQKCIIGACRSIKLMGCCSFTGLFVYNDSKDICIPGNTQHNMPDVAAL